jgi:hypothetical protein
MKFLLTIVFILISPTSYADLEKIMIQNLDLDYTSPVGKGEFEKLSFGVSLKDEHKYPVDIYRRDDSFDVVSHLIEFQWKKPLAFVHNLKEAKIEKLNLKLDRGQHYLRGNKTSFVSPQDIQFLFHRYDIECNGASQNSDPLIRLMYDCREKMRVNIDYTDIPTVFFRALSEELPAYDEDPTMQIPASDFLLNIDQGELYSSVRVKYIIRAYLRIWGFTQYENNGQTLAIRIDQIKFGIVPVTSLVMDLIRRQVNHPDISINPPWIRIKLGNK